MGARLARDAAPRRGFAGVYRKRKNRSVPRRGVRVYTKRQNRRVAPRGYRGGFCLRGARRYWQLLRRLSYQWPPGAFVSAARERPKNYDNYRLWRSAKPQLA